MDYCSNFLGLVLGLTLTLTLTLTLILTLLGAIVYEPLRFLVNSSLPALAAEIKSVQVESDTVYYD